MFPRMMIACSVVFLSLLSFDADARSPGPKGEKSPSKMKIVLMDVELTDAQKDMLRDMRGERRDFKEESSQSKKGFREQFLIDLAEGNIDEAGLHEKIDSGLQERIEHQQEMAEGFMLFLDSLDEAQRNSFIPPSESS